MRCFPYFCFFIIFFSIEALGQVVYPNGATFDKTYLELPEVTGNDTLIIHSGYICRYNSYTLIPDWVAYELTSFEVHGQYKRSGSFGMDPSFSGRQAMREDYSNSGWDKGHMAPAADMKWSQESMFESFFLTNVCPQNHSLNEKIWLTIEQIARRVADENGSVWIICGPIVNENKYGTIGQQNVVVPDQFFKAMLTYLPETDTFSAISFVLNNNDEIQSLTDAAMSIDEIEKILNLNLFCNLERKIQRKVEAKYDLNCWKIYKQ